MFAVGQFKSDFRTIKPEINAVQSTVHACQAFFHGGHSRLQVANVLANLRKLGLQLTKDGHDEVFYLGHRPYSAATAGGA